MRVNAVKMSGKWELIIKWIELLILKFSISNSLL